MEGSTEICCWRELWRLTSGFTPSDLITKRLNGILSQLELGLNFFKPASAESYGKFASQHKEFERFLPFIEKLQNFIGLDTWQTWAMFRNYLVSQYHGSAESALQNFTFIDIRVNQLLVDVAHFYNAERMFMLKELKLMLEYKDSKHTYGKEFTSVIHKIGLEKLKSSLISQLDSLVREGGAGVAGRALREQAELLQLLLLVLEETELSLADFKRLFSIFKFHDFGRQPAHSRGSDGSRDSAIVNVVYCEVALVYKIVHDSKKLNVRSMVEGIREDIEAELTGLQQYEEHGALLLVWLLLLLQDSEGEVMFEGRYQHFGSMALRLRVFEFLHKLITHPIFSDKSRCASILRACVHGVLREACDRFDGDGSLGGQPGVMELCGELLSCPSLAASFWADCSSPSPRLGLVSLWNTALEFFPYDFKALSLLTAGLSKAGKASLANLMHELDRLPVYTELYLPGMVGVSKVMDDEDSVVTIENYYPQRDRGLCVPAQSLASIMDRRGVTLVHFRRPVSYWRVLQAEARGLLGEGPGEGLGQRLLWGVRALQGVLQASPELPCDAVLVAACEGVFEVLVSLAHFQTPLLSLIAACLDISTTLIPNSTQQIYVRLMNIRLLPRVEFTNLTYEEYVAGVSFHTSTLGLYLVNVEQPSGEYPVLHSYLDMLFAFYECNYDRDIATGVLLPGLLFVLREVFPHMWGWRYSSPPAKHRLALKCASYLLKVAQLSPEQTTRPADLLLNKVCVSALLQLDSGLALLKLISLGESNIQLVMEKESNWLNGPGIEYIKIIQVSMAVLMQVLRLKSSVRGKSQLDPLERLIYTQPRQKGALVPGVVPAVAAYTRHPFHPQLPHTACRLLRRFALEFDMSLLVCFDMSPQQVRSMFLERLRDEAEAASLKTVILEFVAACVEKQPGLTEAFFKLSHPQDQQRLFHSEKKSDQMDQDGILTYMAEYLAAVKNNTSSLYSPLLSRIMGLFHALWKNDMQILVKDLRENEDFWEYLCSPLFQNILPDIKAYSQIFNMIAIELFLFKGKVDKSLTAALEKLFSRDERYLSTWLQHIFSLEGRINSGNLVNAVDEVPGWLALLTSWKDLVSVCIKLLPFPLSSEHKALMASHCLHALNQEMERMNDCRTIVILSEMYAVYFSNWKEECFDDRQKYSDQITTLINHTATAFEGLHPRAKNSILAVCTLSLNILIDDAKAESDQSDSIIRSVCAISCSQLEKMFADDEDEPSKKPDEGSGKLNPTVLGLRLLEQCINVFKESFVGWDHWFKASRVANKLVFFVSSSVRKKRMLRQTLAALNCLTALARSSLAGEVLLSDVGRQLWLQLLPPKDLAPQPHAAPLKPHNSLWQVNEWLQVYKCGIEFVTAMLENHKNFFSNEAILFVSVQEDYLNESILLIRQSLDADVLNLTNSALYFISELVKYENQWRQEHFQSMVALMRSISVCFHHCTSVILRPKGIHFSLESSSPLLSQEETDAGPSAKVTTALNKLLHLMHLSAVCLKAFSPNLLTLLAEPEPALGKWQPLLELHFSAPKLSDPYDPFPQLTFGTVMSAVCFLTRSLNCNYQADETPLNSVGSRGGGGGAGRRTGSARRRPPRSDSLSSTASAGAAPAWLAALDRRLTLLTLENILTLLASQALLAAKDGATSSRDKQFIRRELCTELPIFHDFVRKKVLDLTHPKNYLSRKKFGSFPLLHNEEESKELCWAQESGERERTGGAGAAGRECMRVSVVRRLHLEGAARARPPKRVSWDTQPPKRVSWDTQPPPEAPLDPALPDPSSPLTQVQIIEEDYFHFLSNLFLYFCQTDL